ncbi:hypothetical protein NBE98_05695 [Clostridium swellfunianum]|uniref:hypothetical protein n=1 Tax=Clostridium swellfunianum TaxID=1367462 RepID=UPI00202F8D81|nr:hypothetical protein [Clostridium swellfunianum]MCM0647869.1 hypothetical protein [Clostridium swellfunianum]
MMRRIHIKKLMSCILACCIITTFSACKSEKKKGQTEQGNEFEIKVAQNVVDVYMKALMKEDMENAKKLYTKELAEKSKEAGKSDLKVKGYSVEETSEVGRSGFFKIKVTRMSLDKPVATLEECSVKVVKEGTDYKIDEVKNETEKEAFLEQDTIRVRSKNNIKTNLLIDSSSFPQYAFSKDDKGNLSKQIVPRNKFSVMNFGYEGERIAISSYDKDSYIGIIKIDESMATQGGGGGGGGEGQGEGDQGGGGNKKGSQGSMTREKPIGKEMTSLDLLKDAKIEFMTFSNGEKFLVVQYNKSNLGRCIRIYNTDSGELIKEKFEEKYPYGKVEIVFSSFDKDVVNFEVVQKDMNDKAAAELAGKYQMNLKEEFKIKRL